MKMLKGARRVRGARRRHDRRGREGQEVRRPQGLSRERQADQEAPRTRRRTPPPRSPDASTAALASRAARQGVSAAPVPDRRDGRSSFIPHSRSCVHSSPALPLVLAARSRAIARRAAARGSPIGSRCPTRRRTSTRSRSTWTASAARRCRCSCPCGRPAATRRWTSPGTFRSSASTDAAGRPLRWDKTDGSRWVVQTAGARAVRLRYRVFANAALGHVQRARYARTPTGTARRSSCTSRATSPIPSPSTSTPPPGWHIINGDTRTADQTRLPIRELRPAHRHAHRSRAGGACSTRSSSTDSDYRTMVHHNGAAAGRRTRSAS